MVPGPEPQQGPPPQTGDAADLGARGKQSSVTGQQDKIQQIPLMVVHWNAEGITNKKPELLEFLRKNKVDILCPQETHLTDNHRVFVRGYELSRHDRTARHKGGVLTLVTNNVPPVEAHRSGDDGTEFV